MSNQMKCNDVVMLTHEMKALHPHVIRSYPTLRRKLISSKSFAHVMLSFIY